MTADLEARLREFMQHKTTCALNPYAQSFTPEEEVVLCDCGFVVALRRLSELEQDGRSDFSFLYSNGVRVLCTSRTEAERIAANATGQIEWRTKWATLSGVGGQDEQHAH